jgi:hypothetical protein
MPMKSFWIWLSCVWVCVACGAQPAAPLQTQLTLAESLNRTDMTGFLRDKPRQFSFPADHRAARRLCGGMVVLYRQPT